jgi:sorting nexin-1/2
MKRGKELSQGLFDFGLAFTMLSQHEAEALSGALSQMGHTADQLSLVAADHVEKEQRWFEEPITEYLALLGAVKEAVDRRAAVRKAYFAAAADVEAKAAAVQKLKAAGTPAADGKVPVAEAAVAAAEAAEAVAKESLVEVTARLLGEVARFKRVKADEMRKVVLDYVQLQIEYNKQMEQRWADLVPQIEAIQVEALPKVPIFDGALPKWASKPAAEGSGAVV